jgi:hypothetical protein
MAFRNHTGLHIRRKSTMKKFYESSLGSSLYPNWKFLFLIGITIPSVVCALGSCVIANQTNNLPEGVQASSNAPLYIIAVVMLLVAIAGIYFSRRVPPTLQLVFDEDGLSLNKDYSGRPGAGSERKEVIWKLAWNQVHRAECTKIKLPQGGTASGRLTLEVEGQAAPLAIDFTKFMNDRVKILYTLHLYLQKAGQQVEGFSVDALPANEIFQLIGYQPQDQAYGRREQEQAHVQFYLFSYGIYPAQLQKDVLGLFAAIQDVSADLPLEPAARERMRQITSRILIVGSHTAPVWHAEDIQRALSVDELLALRGSWAVVAPVAQVIVPGAKQVGVYGDQLSLALAVNQTMGIVLNAEALISKTDP